MRDNKRAGVEEREAVKTPSNLLLGDIGVDKRYINILAENNINTAGEFISYLEERGDAALLFDPHDMEEMAVAMQRLLIDDNLHAELSEKGLQRSRVFSWERAARRTLDVYRKVAEPQRTAAQPSATAPEKGL